jgi:hypothetical protein
MLQGFSSLGEVMGASIYLVETLRTPYKYVGSGIIDMCTRAGGLFVLFVSSLALSYNLNLRLAFYLGAGIALIGLVARTRLRETVEFIDYKKRLKLKKFNYNILSSRKGEKIDKKALISLALSTLMISVSFYIVYIYLGNFMKINLGMLPEQVIKHNMKLSFCSVIATCLLSYSYKKFHPLKIARISLITFAIIIPFIPYWLNNINNSKDLFILQFIIYIASSIFLHSYINQTMWAKYFPIQKRFFLVASTFGVMSAFGAGFAAFSLTPLTYIFGYYALLIIFVPIIIGCYFSLAYLKN